MHTLLEQVVGRINYIKKTKPPRERADIFSELRIEQILQRGLAFCPSNEFKRLYTDWRAASFGFNRDLAILMETPMKYSYMTEEYLRSMNLLSIRELKIGQYMSYLCNQHNIVPNFDLSAVEQDGKTALNIWRLLKEFGVKNFMKLISLENEKSYALEGERYEDIQGIEKRLGRIAMNKTEILEYCEKFGKILEYSERHKSFPI